MPSGLLTIWPFYLVGSVVIFLGFLGLHAWIRGITGKGPDRPGSMLAASALAFVLGFATVAIAIGIDQAQVTSFNVRSLVYHIEIRLHGSSPVELALPAPADSGFFAALNRTAGTSSLQLSHAMNDTTVIVIASTDVTFDVRTQFVSEVFNETVTHVATVSGSGVFNAAAAIRMIADGTNTTTAHIVLEVQIVESCRSTTLLVTAEVLEGTGKYPGTVTKGSC